MPDAISNLGNLVETLAKLLLRGKHLLKNQPPLFTTYRVLQLAEVEILQAPSQRRKIRIFEERCLPFRFRDTIVHLGVQMSWHERDIPLSGSHDGGAKLQLEGFDP